MVGIMRTNEPSSVLWCSGRGMMARIASVEGFRGVYRGLLATLMRDVPFSVFMFPAQAELVNHFHSQYGKRSIHDFFGGVIAGGFAAAAVTPMDVIKTRCQLEMRPGYTLSIPEAVRMVLKDAGPSGFTRGMLARAVTIAPIFGLSFLIFEQVKVLFLTTDIGRIVGFDRSKFAPYDPNDS